MFLTRRLAYVVALVVFLLSLGFLWPFLYPVGFVAAGLLVGFLVLNILLLYVGKPQFLAVRSNPERLSVGDENEITISLVNHYGRSVHVDVYDEPPFTLQMRDFKMEADLKAGEELLLKYHVRPTRRGSYVFHNVNCFVSVWPHLLQRRFKSDQTFRTKVYPSFLFLRNAQLLSEDNKTRMWGNRSIRQIGQSREFEKIREYVVGDDYRTINWKASARRNLFMVNEFQTEQSQNIYAVIDKGRGMQHTFSGLSLFDHSLNSALQLCYLSIQRADNAGILTFEQKVETYIQASRSPRQLQTIMSTVYKEVSDFNQSDYFNLYEFCKRKIQKRSLLIIYTTFDSLSALRRQLPYLKKLATLHVVLVTFFVDKDVETIAMDKTSEPIDYVSQMVAQKFLFDQKLIVNELRRYGIFSLLTHPENLNADVINQYLEFKSRNII